MFVSKPWAFVYVLFLIVSAPTHAQSGCPGFAQIGTTSIFDGAQSLPQLREAILARSRDEAGRNALAAEALARMKARAPQTVGKKKVIFIGAGIHGVTALSNYVGRDARVAADVLMVEAGDVVSANFGQGQPFHVNSGIPDFVGTETARPNEMPGAVVSPEDFRYNAGGDNAYPTPKVFSDAATISLAAQNVDVLFRTRIASIEEHREAGAPARYTLVTTDGRRFDTDAIVMGMGVSAPKITVTGLRALHDEEKAAAEPRVQVYTDFLRDIGVKGRASYDYLRGKTIGIIGAQHGGNITVEALLGKVPESAGDTLGSKIIWWGQKARGAQEFLDIQHPGGGDHPRQLFKVRYAKYGIPEAFTSGLIEPVAQKATEVRRLPSGRFLIVSSGPQGPPEEREVDAVFIAQGFETPALGILRGSFPSEKYDVLLSPLVIESAPQKFESAASRFVSPDGHEQSIFLIGPGAMFPIDPKRTEDSITGSPESINVLAPLTAGFGKWLRGLVGVP